MILSIEEFFFEGIVMLKTKYFEMKQLIASLEEISEDTTGEFDSLNDQELQDAQIALEGYQDLLMVNQKFAKQGVKIDESIVSGLLTLASPKINKDPLLSSYSEESIGEKAKDFGKWVLEKINAIIAWIKEKFEKMLNAIFSAKRKATVKAADEEIKESIEKTIPEAEKELKKETPVSDLTSSVSNLPLSSYRPVFKDPSAVEEGTEISLEKVVENGVIIDIDNIYVNMSIIAPILFPKDSYFKAPKKITDGFFVIEEKVEFVHEDVMLDIIDAEIKLYSELQVNNYDKIDHDDLLDFAQGIVDELCDGSINHPVDDNKIITKSGLIVDKSLENNPEQLLGGNTPFHGSWSDHFTSIARKINKEFNKDYFIKLNLRNLSRLGYFYEDITTYENRIQKVNAATMKTLSVAENMLKEKDGQDISDEDIAKLKEMMAFNERLVMLWVLLSRRLNDFINSYVKIGKIIQKHAQLVSKVKEKIPEE